MITEVLDVIGGVGSLFEKKKNPPKITEADVNKIYPSSGYWHNRLKSYLVNRNDIHQGDNARIIEAKKWFVDEFRSELIPSLPPYNSAITSAEFSRALAKLDEELAKEQSGISKVVGGVENLSNELNNITGMSINPLVWIGALVLIVWYFFKNKKRKLF